MKYDPEIYNRHSLRIKGYDYSGAGVYFITICTNNRDNLFGEIIDNKMFINAFGKIVENEWIKTPEIRNIIEIDSFVIMPNHFHGIIVINDAGRGVLQYALSTKTNEFKSPSQTIGAVIRGFKSTVTKQINIFRNMQMQSIWQRNYYEHIIRNEDDLLRIREYIIKNQENWENDEEYHL